MRKNRDEGWLPFTMTLQWGRIHLGSSEGGSSVLYVNNASELGEEGLSEIVYVPLVWNFF
ncbi:hypothetical protein CUMW_278490 [Citrus unshiu]|uniref:Uncharacterized protein n=1 Tax=Citrus unshiu TaxID=55188 RepID=A0A2H5N5I7_CITUN|nr:hypothetical protein CUMW_278490 [Citrus unshiu]